jgi:hypothetical protein
MQPGKELAVVRLIDFSKDEAAQELLEYAGITEPYEELIDRVSLGILRQSVPDCEIESIRYLRSAGSHSRMRAGGMPIANDSSNIKLQDMTMPFDLEITVRSGAERHLLNATFRFECRKMDEIPQNEYFLDIHEQKNA